MLFRSVIYGSEGLAAVYATLAASFTKVAGYSFLIFNLLCAPCFAAMGAKITEANINGSFWESGLTNVRIAYVANLAWALWAGRLTQTLAFFYLGILVGRHRLFYNEGNNLRIWRWVLIICFPLCLIGSNVDMGSFSVWTKPITNMLILFSEEIGRAHV